MGLEFVVGPDVLFEEVEGYAVEDEGYDLGCKDDYHAYF